MLSARMVDRRLALQQQLRNRHDLEPLRLVFCQDNGQRLNDIFRIVMKQHDVARRAVFCRSFDQIVDAAVFPIQRVDVPLHTFVPLCPAGSHDGVVIIAVRRTEQRRAYARNLLDPVGVHAQLLDDLRF